MSKKTIKSPSTKSAPSNDLPLPPIAAFSSGTSPKASGKVDEGADEASRSEGSASDMLVDSEHSSTPASLGGKGDKGDDNMVIDTPVTKASKASTPAD